MTKPACLPQLSAPWPLSQVMLRTLAFGRLLEDIFHRSVLFDSIISCRFKALCTNQKMELYLWCRFGAVFFVGVVGLVWGFFVPFLLGMWLLLFIWRTRRGVSLRTWRTSVSKTGSGWCVSCLWSELLTDVTSSINLLTFARPRQWESTKRNSTEEIT